MKEAIKHRLGTGLLLLITGSTGLLAQEEIIFSPADLIPHEEGYYITGVWVDDNNDGIDEFYNGCADFYENTASPQENHVESGDQQGFTYEKCMIMPDCEPKGTPIDPPVHNGYIQIAPCIYSGTDSASLSYILTPPLRNLESLRLETSSDVSINDNRKIPYFIEYSLDGGTSWESSFVQDYVSAQGGDRKTYDGSGFQYAFKDMIDASDEGPVTLRIITNDLAAERPIKGQYVKVHYISITARLNTGMEEALQTAEPCFTVHRRTIISRKGEMSVLTLQGRLVATGTSISLPSAGIYLVRTHTDQSVHKIFAE